MKCFSIGLTIGLLKLFNLIAANEQLENRTNISSIAASNKPQVSHAQGRALSNWGQMFWTQSTDAKINKDSNTHPVEVQTSRKLHHSSNQFFYPVYNPNKFDDYHRDELDDNQGEVEEIDRYIPKPYFGYGAATPNGGSDSSKPTSNYQPQPTMNFPEIVSNSKPPTGNSDYGDGGDDTISYTPPPGYIDDMKNESTLVDSYTPQAAGPVNGGIPPDFDGYVYPPNDDMKYYPSMVVDDMHSSKPMMMDMNGPIIDLPPPRPADLPEYLYYNPEDEKDHHHHHHHHPDHHHVYHEVITTTTTPKPEEKERVNKRPYSYYYLGRKLWYIPLYFSLYFIVYIFALIIKSIMRHKVQFPNEHDWSKINRRSLDLNYDHPQSEILNTATETVMKALESDNMDFM